MVLWDLGRRTQGAGSARPFCGCAGNYEERGTARNEKAARPGQLRFSGGNLYRYSEQPSTPRDLRARGPCGPTNSRDLRT